MPSLRLASINTVYFFIFGALSVLADVPVCEISPGTRAKEINIYCPSGTAKTPINADSEIESQDSFNLNLKDGVFNNPRTIKIFDSVSKDQLLLKIEVKSSNVVDITNLIPHKTFILNGFARAHLKELSMLTKGQLIVLDSITTVNKLEIESNNIYLVEPFIVHQGTFRLKYQDGFISRLNSPFNIKIDNNYATIESLKLSLNPSKRQANLSHIKHSIFKTPLEDISESYNKAFSKHLEDKYELYKQKITDTDKQKYLESYVLPKITDNIKKGMIGENIYKLHMEKKYPNYKFKDPKIGLNSFDAVYFEREIPGDELSPIKQIIISEVKYAKNGKPALGFREIDGHKWRQLSLPYVKNVIADMLKTRTNTVEIAEQINKNLNLVKLQLAVFNPANLDLIIYEIGDMTKSELD